MCGININWFRANACFFRLFSTENTIVLDCMQPIVCFWSVNNSFLIFISIICIQEYSADIKFPELTQQTVKIGVL